LNKGYIQIYTGNGKGKTTASLGLALRALGAGLKVYIAQFVKGQEYSEIKMLRKFEPELVIRQYGSECFIYKDPEPVDFELAQKGWKEVGEIVHSERYDLIILDEINIALYYHLISEESVIDLLVNKPLKTEIVLTGRKMPSSLFDYADLITNMEEVKHYYQKGIQAREGIEY